MRKTILQTEALKIKTIKRQYVEYRRRKIVIPAKKNYNTGEEILKYWRRSNLVLTNKYYDVGKKYIQITFYNIIHQEKR